VDVVAWGRGRRSWPAWLEWLAPGQQGDLNNIEFEFVRMEKMAGYQRWRLVFRRDPATPWSAADFKFAAGSSHDVYEDAVALNDRLAKEFEAGQRLERERARQREKERREERDEGHRAGLEDGTHSAGVWWNCPVCNPSRSPEARNRDYRDRKGEEGDRRE
jgi:hypothetical protein